MVKLYLIRHGHAGDPDRWEGPDDSRPISERGRRDLRRTADVLARRETIDILCTSPLVRAVQTAEIFAQALEIDDVEVLEELRPDVPVQTVLDRVAQFEGKRIGLTGHDPQMTGLVAALSGESPEKLRFPKGAVVRFDVADLASREAQARWWLAPREKEAEEGLPLREEGED
jgi:phosphohistidine phosphatase